MWWLPSADAGPVSRAAPPTTEVTESSTNQFSHIYNTVQYIQTQPARSQLWSYQPHKPVLSYIQYNTLQNIQTQPARNQLWSYQPHNPVLHIIYTTQYRTYKHNQLEASYGLINNTNQFSHIYNTEQYIQK